MKWWIAVLTIAAPGMVLAQSVLEFRNDLAFGPGTVESFAEKSYREKLRALESGGNLDADPALTARLGMLVAKLQVAVAVERPDRSPIHWEIHTCRRCSEDASAMAGGKLLIGQEFLLALEPTDDELAYLLAHEMAHVVAEHTREFASAARYFVDNGLRRNYADIQEELDQSLSDLLRMAWMSRQQELEADYIAIVLGARAGFDPDAMLGMLRKLGSDGATPILATHPSNRQRISLAHSLLPIGRALQASSNSGP